MKVLIDLMLGQILITISVLVTAEYVGLYVGKAALLAMALALFYGLYSAAAYKP